MIEERPPIDGRRPRPVCAVLAAASPFAGGFVPFIIAMADSSPGDFTFMIALMHGAAGAFVGLLASAFLTGCSRERHERHPWIAALITIVVLPAILFLVFVGFMVA